MGRQLSHTKGEGESAGGARSHAKGILCASSAADDARNSPSEDFTSNDKATGSPRNRRDSARRRGGSESKGFADSKPQRCDGPASVGPEAAGRPLARNRRFAVLPAR